VKACFLFLTLPAMGIPGFTTYKESLFEETLVHFKLIQLQTRVEFVGKIFYIDSVNIPAIIQQSKNNFDLVYNTYLSSFSAESITHEQKTIICNVSLYVTFSWLSIYSKQPIEDWPIKEQDIKSPLTVNKIITYFTGDTSSSWKEIAAKLVDMPLDKFLAYYENWKKVQKLF